MNVKQGHDWRGDRDPRGDWRAWSFVLCRLCVHYAFNTPSLSISNCYPVGAGPAISHRTYIKVKPPSYLPSPFIFVFMEFTPNLRKQNNFPSALQESIKMESNKPMNLELPLFPSTAHTSSIPTMRGGGGGGGSPQEQQQRQQLTIFYNGRICVSDVTELRVWMTVSGSLFPFPSPFPFLPR